jgi:hypothetical protein
MSSLYTPAQWEKAKREVDALRKEFPNATQARLVRQLVKTACVKAGATGAGTTAVGLIPGIGKMLGWAVGLAGDAAMTASIQRDLILAIFVLHGRTPNAADEAQMIKWMGQVGVGAIEIIEHVGGGFIKNLAKRVMGKVLRRGLPVLEVMGSTATHVVGTYLLARKVDAYCRGTPDEPVDVDPRRIRNWTMLSLGTVLDDKSPKSVKDAFRDE